MKCPICGEKNDCGLHDSNDCWCFQTKVPSTLLKQIPSDQRRKACVCSKCVEKSEKSSK
ncbi:MAG TPA: cysteine-rich CWC family protein [Pseudogracilibacillus sp.]|nr:cysteine-rich CWC family protein [Pseudogracilibacillus sp.]